MMNDLSPLLNGLFGPIKLYEVFILIIRCNASLIRNCDKEEKNIDFIGLCVALVK